MMNASELVRRCVDVAKNYKTLYVMGCFGAPLNAANKKRYTQNHTFNKAADRTKMINAATANTFGFDCVNLIKGILWGWSGDTSKNYGGASYASRGVPDVSADGMIKLCKGVTTDFKGIVPGAAVWCSGHIGVYIGDGLAVECTPKWSNCVQITAVGNIGKKSGYNTRTWTKWGKMPYINYEEDDDMTEAQVKQIAQEVAKAVCAEQAQQGYASFKAYMEQYRKELAALPVPDWAAQNGEWDKAFAAGIIAEKTRPQDLASRAEVAAMVFRAKNS